MNFDSQHQSGLQRRAGLPALLAALALAFGAGAVQAQESSSTPRADQRQQNQAGRIADGKASGELTARERRRLNAEQRSIERAEQRAAADGKVTARERRHLENKQDRASRDIYRQKHDRQRAHRPGGAASGTKP